MTDPPRLRIYGILRGDLDLKPGHASAKLMQAGIVSFAKSPQELKDAYPVDGEGTQVVLMVPDEVALRRAHLAAVLP